MAVISISRILHINFVIHGRPWFILIVCCSAVYAESQDVPCDTNIFLEVGKQGTVPCHFEGFLLLSWINGDGNHEVSTPFIYLENSEEKGRGYDSGDYNLLPDGSLIINNVTLKHEYNFTVVYLPPEGAQTYFKVPVRVFVRPNPEYPVVNGLTNQQYIVQDVEFYSGSINCAMNRVRPEVELEWVFQSDVISVENESFSFANNTDETYNTSLSSRFTIRDRSVGKITLQCRVAGEMADLFTLVTTIYLLNLNKHFPVVNGEDNKQHVVLQLSREDEMTCALDRVLQGVSLEWVILSPQDEVVLESVPAEIDNGDGTFDVTLSSRFSMIGPSVHRVILHCGVSGQAVDVYPDITTVEVLLSEHFPVVNGKINRGHLVLHLRKEDEMTCALDRVLESVSLEWMILSPQDEVALESEISKSSNGDGTFNVTLKSRFSMIGLSVHHVILQCGVSGQAVDMYPDITTVEVLLTEKFPVVNGLARQQHVVLHLKREDELTCSINRVSKDISLEWVIITSELSNEIIFKDHASAADNGDGTSNITLTSSFSVMSSSVQHVTLQCRISGQGTNLYPDVTTVEVFFSDSLPIPVIDGCYSQQEDCTLKMPRDGSLTCSVMAIPVEYTMDMGLDIFADYSGLSLTRIKNDHLPHISGDYDLITSYQYTADLVSTESVIKYSLSGVKNNQPFNSTATARIIWQGTASDGVARWTLIIVVIILIILLSILIVFLSKKFVTTDRMYSLCDQESKKGIEMGKAEDVQEPLTHTAEADVKETAFLETVNHNADAASSSDSSDSAIA